MLGTFFVVLRGYVAITDGVLIGGQTLHQSHKKNMPAEKVEISRPVPLAGWTLTPSIDFITLCMEPPEARALGAALIDAHPKRQVAKRGPNKIFSIQALKEAGINIAYSKKARCKVITVHDPDLRELQQMIDTYPNAWLAEIEFTIDFRPDGEPAGEDELAPVFKWLRDCVFPPMPGARQKAYVQRTEKYERRYDIDVCALTTRKWDSRRSWSQMRLYIKKHDHNRTVVYPSVRLEAILGSGACQDIGMSRLWQLVGLIPDLRKRLSPYFVVASGIKPKLIRIRDAHGKAGLRDAALNEREVNKVQNAWRFSGAMWAARNGYRVYPHEEANKRIGDALGKLRGRLLRLELPENSCLPDTAHCPEGRVRLKFDDWTPLSPIDAKGANDSPPDPLVPPVGRKRLAK